MLILSWVLIITLIIGLALLIYLAFTKNYNDIQLISHKIATIQSTESMLSQQIPAVTQIGPPGPQGLQGPAGKDGVDSVSTTTIIEQPIQGPTGPQGTQGVSGRAGLQGIPGKDARQVEFDGNGHWRYTNDDLWLPLVKGIQ